MTEQGQTTTAVSRAFKALRGVLSEIGWEPREDSETGGLVIDFDPPYIPVAYAYAGISEPLELFIFYITLGVAAAADRREEAARYLTLANWNLMSGNFSMDYEDGEIRFRTSVCFQGTELTEALIRNAILLAMHAMERFAEGAIDVMARDKKAEQAFREAVTQSRPDLN